MSFEGHASNLAVPRFENDQGVRPRRVQKRDAPWPRRNSSRTARLKGDHVRRGAYESETLGHIECTLKWRVESQVG
jgi:hypothetical protein